MKWQMRIVATLAGLIVAVPTGVHTQKPMTLTALDYIEIEQLVAKYSRALDSCSNNGYDYADLYTPDGVFAPTLNGKPGRRFEGRERLAEASGGGKLGCKNVAWIQQGVRHLYHKHVIRPTTSGAVGGGGRQILVIGG